MAKLRVELDTETDGVSVWVDGTIVENVSYVSVNNYGCYYDSQDSQKFHFNVETNEKVGDVNRRVSLCASQIESAVASAKYPGLFEKSGETDGPKTEAGFEIAQAFLKGRKVSPK